MKQFKVIFTNGFVDWTDLPEGWKAEDLERQFKEFPNFVKIEYR